MNLSTHISDEMKFVGANDVTKVPEADDRLIHCVPEPKPESWNFGPGDNYFFVLPSSSSYLTYFPNNVDDYQIGKPFNQVVVKKIGMTRPRTYRAPRNNPLAEKFWVLYNVLYKARGNEAEWRRITTSGFQCGGDPRRALNIIVAKSGPNGPVFSPVKIFRVPDEKSSAKKIPGQLPPLYVQIVQALAQAFKMMNDPSMVARCPSLKVLAPTRNNLQLKYPFFPEHAAMLKLTVSFRGTIPQYTSLQLVMTPDGAPQCFNLSNLHDLSQSAPASLDACSQWASEVDELPDIRDVEPIITSPIACEILGIQHVVSPVAAPVVPVVSQVPQQAAVFANPAQPAVHAVVAPVVPAAVSPVSTPQQLVSPPAQVQPTAPVVPPVVPPTSPVPQLPSAAEASAMFLEKLQAELKKHQPQSGGSQQPPVGPAAPF